MPLRELLAFFGVKFDDSELKEGSKSLDGLSDRIRNFAGVAAAVGLGFGIKSFIDGIRTTGNEIDNVSKQLGLSAQQLQEWQFIAGDVGLDAGDLFGAFGAISDNAANAALGSKDMTDAFKQLGVTVKDNKGELKDTETLILEMADGLSLLSNETARSNVLQTVAGDDGLRLLGVLKQQRSGIEAVRTEFRRLGGGLQDDTIKASVLLTNELGKLGVAFTSVKSLIGLAVLPAITRFTEGVIETVRSLQELLKGTRIVEVAFVALGIAAAALAVKIIAAFIVPIAIFAAVAASIAAVILIVDDLIALFTGGKSAIGEFVDEMFGVGTAANVVQDLLMLWEQVVQTVKDATTVVSDFLDIDLPFGLGLPDTQQRSQRGLTAREIQEANQTPSQRTAAQRAGVARQVQIQNTRGGARSVNQNNNNTFNVTGSNPQEIAGQVRQLVDQVQGEQNAAALAALVPEAEPNG